MGGKVIGNKLSRVDACADLPHVGIEEFMSAFRQQRYVTRAMTRCENGEETLNFKVFGYGRQDTGFTIGKNIMLRVYEKKIEVRSQPLKEAILIEHRWGAR